MNIFAGQDIQSLLLTFLGKALLALGAGAVLYVATKILVNHIQKKIEESTLEVNSYTKRTSSLVGSVISIVCMIFAILIIAEIVGIQTALIMGGLSLGIGFAMETTIGNMVGGIMLLFNKKIKVGEMVELLGSLHTKATVQEFHIRYTVISTLTKQRIIIPNMTLVKTPIKTYKAETLIKSSLTLSVGRHVSLEQAKGLIRKIVNNHEYVLQKEDTKIIVSNFNAHGVELTCWYFMNPHDTSPFVINTILRERIHQASKDYGIIFAYNNLTLFTNNQTPLQQGA